MNKLMLILVAGLFAIAAQADTDDQGFEILHKGEKVIIKPLALLFGKQADLTQYERFLADEFDPPEGREAYYEKTISSRKAVKVLKPIVAIVVAVVIKNPLTHQVEVQVADTKPVWVDGALVGEYTLDNMVNGQP